MAGLGIDLVLTKLNLGFTGMTTCSMMVDRNFPNINTTCTAQNKVSLMEKVHPGICGP
jgi:hypothetical protein